MQHPKSFCFLLILIVSCSASLHADECFQCNSLYAYGDLGGSKIGDGLVFLQLGGGIERTLHQGWTIGAEAGVLAPYAEFSAAPFTFTAQTTCGLFRGREIANVIPFVGAGYTITSIEGLAHYPHLSVGIDRWKNSMGLRVEFRMYFWKFESGKTMARSIRCAYLLRW